jgi:hypothetical protein
VICGETTRTDTSSILLHRAPFYLYIAFGILVALSVAVKAPVWELQPQVFSDSAGYLVPAVSMLDGHGYGAQENGFRGPTYPLFLGLVLAPFDRTELSKCRDAHRPTCLDSAAKTGNGEFEFQAIVVVQILFGFLTAALLFALGWRLTRNVLVAICFGAGYALNLATAFWEISILTETLTTFLLTFAVYLTLRADRGSRGTFVILGFALAVLALCHQLFLAYWVLPVLFLFARKWRHKGLRRALSTTAPVFLVPLAFVGAWCTFNYAVNGVFTPSTLSGYVLIQMVAPVVQNAPRGYDGIVQPYVGFRDAMIAQTGSHSGAIFRAWPTMIDWTGLTWSEISRKLTALTFYLMIHYPQTYFQLVKEGWARFWDFQIYHYDPIPSAVPTWAVQFTEAAEQGFLNLLLAISAAVFGIIFIARRESDSAARSVPFGAVVFLIMTILFAAVVTALTNFQDNARLRTYVLPMQYAVIVLSVWAVWRERANRLRYKKNT